jgi:hypothetical protein
MEAFLMALLENQYDVLTAQCSMKKGNNRDKRICCCPLLLKKDATPEQVAQGYIIEGDYINVWGPKWPLSTPTTNPATADLRVGPRKVRNATQNF